MLPVGQVAQQMQTTRVKALKVSSDVVAKHLEACGFSRDIAGPDDFDKAVRAVCAMFEHGRGLFLTGAAGCGKTQLMRAVQRWLNPHTLNWVYVKEPADIEYMRSRDDDILKTNVYVDDIGCEEIIREYGNVVDVVGDFTQRYHYRGEGRFFATTNLNSEEINQRYGTRMLDRILEMCVVMKFDGKTKRERIVIK